MNTQPLIVESIEQISESVACVRLRSSTGIPLRFMAGQYLAINTPYFESAYYSIANAAKYDFIEIHIKTPKHKGLASAILNHLKTCHTVDVQLPLGKACFDTLPDSPLLLIAGGTGFSQMKSIIETLFDRGFQKSITLYWSAPTIEEIYLHDLIEKWQSSHKNFICRTFTRTANINASYQQSIIRTILKEQHNLSELLVFASGSPRLVHAALDALIEAGLPADNFLSDALGSV